MKAASNPAFESLIEKLDDCIAKALAAKLTDTVALLRVVKVDLLVRANRISEQELDTFLTVLGQKRRKTATEAPRLGDGTI
jgi:hypothetical protein